MSCLSGPYARPQEVRDGAKSSLSTFYGGARWMFAHGNLFFRETVYPPGPVDVTKTLNGPGHVRLLAKFTMDVASRETQDRAPAPKEQKKNPAAFALGYLGPVEGGNLDLRSWPSDAKSKTARNAANAPWRKA
jgi:hypothetical protein